MTLLSAACSVAVRSACLPACLPACVIQGLASYLAVLASDRRSNGTRGIPFGVWARIRAVSARERSSPYRTDPGPGDP